MRPACSSKNNAAKVLAMSGKKSIIIGCVLVLLAGVFLFYKTSYAAGCIPNHSQCVEDTPENRILAAREHYEGGESCYTRLAICERQASGQCGWTSVAGQLEACLKSGDFIHYNPDPKDKP
jgi:hypothetical protein